MSVTDAIVVSRSFRIELGVGLQVAAAGAAQREDGAANLAPELKPGPERPLGRPFDPFRLGIEPVSMVDDEAFFHRFGALRALWCAHGGVSKGEMGGMA